MKHWAAESIFLVGIWFCTSTLAYAEKAIYSPSSIAQSICEQRNLAKQSPVINGELLAKLLARFPIKKTETNLHLSDREILAKSWCVSPGKPAKHCEQKDQYPFDIVLGDDSSQFRIRQTLLRLFFEQSQKQAPRSIKTEWKNRSEDIGPIHDPAKQHTKYDDEERWLKAFLGGLDKNIRTEPVFFVSCSTSPHEQKYQLAQHAPSEIDAFLFPNSGTPSANKKVKDKHSFKILKDADQFASSSPQGAEVGTTILGDGTNTEFTADIALGLVSQFTPNNYKTEPWNCSTEHSCAGIKRTYSLYASYSQKPSKIEVFDTNSRAYADGTFPLKNSTFAYGVISGGARIDVEWYPGFYGDNSAKQRVNLYSREGRRPAGHLLSGTLEVFTDNYLDLQGAKIEGKYTPPESWFGSLAGYRHQSRAFGGALASSYMWSTSLVLDHINYARAPKDRNAGAVRDARRPVNDFTRVGFDTNIAVSGRRPFSISADPSWWKLRYTYGVRDPLDGSESYADFDKVDLEFNDILAENWTLSLGYVKGRDLDTLENEETFKLGAKWKRK